MKQIVSGFRPAARLFVRATIARGSHSEVQSFRRARVGWIARPIVTGVNHLAEAVDARSARLREPAQPGTLFANFHVVAEVPK